MFCSLDDLVDEASIQTRFVNPLLAYLGYTSDKIHTKESIEKSPIPEGAKNEGYIPDYVLFDSHDQPVVVLEVRGTSEKKHTSVDLPADRVCLCRESGIPTGEMACAVCHFDQWVHA